MNLVTFVFSHFIVLGNHTFLNIMLYLDNVRNATQFKARKHIYFVYLDLKYVSKTYIYLSKTYPPKSSENTPDYKYNEK
jgi:hypothetical protein